MSIGAVDSLIEVAGAGKPTHQSKAGDYRDPRSQTALPQTTKRRRKHGQTAATSKHGVHYLDYTQNAPVGGFDRLIALTEFGLPVDLDPAALPSGFLGRQST